MNETKKRYAMAYLIDRCIDCKACMIACKTEWNTPAYNFRTHIATKDVEFGKDIFRSYYLPEQCNHCTDAPCVSVCPTKASYHDENGIVNIDVKRCVGCKYCIPSCPYNSRFFDDKKGVADKCTFCRPRIETGLLPACVTTCLSGARVFGDMNDSSSPVSLVLKDAVAQKSKIWTLRQDLGTGPTIYYIQNLKGEKL